MRCPYWEKCTDTDKAKKGERGTKCYHTEEWMKCLAFKYLKEHL